MKQLFLILYLTAFYSQAQNKEKYWQSPDYLDFKENAIRFSIKSDTTVSVKGYTIKATWDEYLYYSNNTEHFHPGVCNLTITKKGKEIYRSEYFGNPLGIDELWFRFYDFNKDNFLDFCVNSAKSGATMTLYNFYIYNKETGLIELNEQWLYPYDWY